MSATINPNPYAPPTAEVSDAADTGTFEQADRGARLGAAIVDILVSVVVVLPVLIALAMAVGTGSLGTETIISAVFGTMGYASMVLGIAWVAVTIYLVNKNGQTIGKKMLGIKVVRSDGSRASLGRIFWLRNFVNGIPASIPYIGSVYGLADALWIFGEKRQCLHDKIADTIVIRA